MKPRYVSYSFNISICISYQKCPCKASKGFCGALTSSERRQVRYVTGKVCHSSRDVVAVSFAILEKCSSGNTLQWMKVFLSSSVVHVCDKIHLARLWSPTAKQQPLAASLMKICLQWDPCRLHMGCKPSQDYSGLSADLGLQGNKQKKRLKLLCTMQQKDSFDRASGQN